MNRNILSVDLGATSGRLILAKIDNTRFSTEELIRFPNRLNRIFGKYYWDIYSILANIIKGLQIAAGKGIKIDSIGVDTWGVDFVFVGADGQLLGLPRAYRDPYTSGIPEKYFKLVQRREVYQRTGIQIMNFNSLFQLYAANLEGCSALKAAKRILFMPDAISYLLTGNEVTEYTILSTSQLMDPRTKELDRTLLSAAGVDADMFAQTVMPGHIIGTLTQEIQQQTGLGAIPVIAVAGHDTASAIAAVPSADRNFAYLSSGTWSLMGIETREPIIDESSFEMNFTNEGGIEGTTRFLKNITGMWILECCRREWEAEGKEYTYQQIAEMTAQAQPFASFIDPDDSSFASPTRMLEAVKSYCRINNQRVPEDDKALVRCIFDSLAMKYRYVLERLESLAPFPIERLHVIGGGARNSLLNQMTADAIGIPVIAGPSEATAIGNIMVQAKALGMVGSIEEMRSYISRSVDTETYQPKQHDLWDREYPRFIEAMEI